MCNTSFGKEKNAAHGGTKITASVNGAFIALPWTPSFFFPIFSSSFLPVFFGTSSFRFVFFYLVCWHAHRAPITRVIGQHTPFDDFSEPIFSKAWDTPRKRWLSNYVFEKFPRKGRCLSDHLSCATRDVCFRMKLALRR